MTGRVIGMARAAAAMMMMPVAAAMMPAAAMAQAGDAAGRIAAYNKTVNAIETAGLGQPARESRFEAVVQSYYDMPAIAALVAGPAWSRASAADRSAAESALVRHSAVSLARNFKGPTATRFTVDPQVIQRAGSPIVKVTTGSDTLYYRMRGGRIVDVISGGVSQLALQRADIAGTVASGGVAAMAAKLKQLDAR